jgi:hypothetical protein
MDKKKILDIGAGDNPDKRATHAVDESLSLKELKTAKKKAPKLVQYYEGDFRHPPKEMKGEFDKVVSHFAPAALEGKSASRALDYVTKDNATAEIEVGLDNAPKVVQILHDANFKVSSVEATQIPTVIPALGVVGGDVTIKAEKRKGYGKVSFYERPVRVKLPHRRQDKKGRMRRLTTHCQSPTVVSLRTIRRG